MGNFFDIIAPVYDWFMRVSGLHQAGLSASYLPGVAGWEIADLGGGTGFHARMLAARGAQVTVVDRSAAMLERIPKTGGIRPCRADLAASGLPDGAFDAVLLIDVLHHRHAASRQSSRLNQLFCKKSG